MAITLVQQAPAGAHTPSRQEMKSATQASSMRQKIFCARFSLEMTPASRSTSRCFEVVDQPRPQASTRSQTQRSPPISVRTMVSRAGLPSALKTASAVGREWLSGAWRELYFVV